jgi:dTDP-4-dehydrorhamnose reductase
MILLIGSTGYIGSEFKKQFESNNIQYITISYADVEREKIIRLIKANNIKYIINCAAFVGIPNIEQCESQKDKTINGNIILPILLKEISQELDIVYCHISTGCLYNGTSPNINGWQEVDEPNFSFKFNNCSFYTGTKVMSEQYISSYQKTYIWRIRLPFENKHNNRNYISKIINYDTLVSENNSISNKIEFVKACIDSIKLEIPFGIYNITNTGYISSIEIAEKLIHTICPNKKSKFLKIDDFYKKINSMPRSNCIIDNSKLLSTGIKISEVNESINWCLKNWKW